MELFLSAAYVSAFAAIGFVAVWALDRWRGESSTLPGSIAITAISATTLLTAVIALDHGLRPLTAFRAGGRPEIAAIVFGVAVGAIVSRIVLRFLAEIEPWREDD